MSNVIEFRRSADELNIGCYPLDLVASKKIIREVEEKFSPEKLTGHVSIGHNSVSVPLDAYEFSYSQYLQSEPIYVFFDQLGDDQGCVLILDEGRSLGKVLENAFGMEYFITNEKMDYLLAINWYVIEGSGSAVDWLGEL